MSVGDGPMTAASLRDLLRVGCVQVFVPVSGIWVQINQREARHLRAALHGRLSVARRHAGLDRVLSQRCGGGKILRLVPWGDKAASGATIPLRELDAQGGE
jgi:hypothetical protein